MIKKIKPAKLEVEETATVPEVETSTEPTKVEETVKSVIDTPKEIIRTYLGKVVVAVNNAVVSGKIYKDVSVNTGETFRLTEAEFNKETKTL
jgi:hypothetical protein